MTDTWRIKRCIIIIIIIIRYLEALPEDHVLVKLDFSNAFNSIYRREMLLAVHSRMPELYSFCCSAYNQPSV